MADVSYESLQSKIASQRAIIRQQKTAGERGIESLRRVHPKTPPSQYFGQVEPQIKTIRSRLGELKTAEKELSEHGRVLAERKAEGYKIRETDEGKIEFYKEVYTPGERIQVGTREVSVMVHWINPKTGKTGRFQGRQSNIADYERQLGVTGRQVTKVTTIGGGEPIYKKKEGFWTTKDVILWEAPPIIERGVSVPTEKRVGDITVRHIGMDKDMDLGFGERPRKAEPITDAEIILGKQLGLGRVKTFKEIQKAQIETYEFKKLEYEKKKIEFEKKKGELKRLMKGTPIEWVAGLAIWVTTGLLSWEDPFGILSAYYALRGEPEKAIETKARAVVGLPIGEPWSPERFKFLERAYTGPLAMAGITYGVSAGLGAGIGAFEATTVGKYPLLISKGVKIVAGVTKPIWTLTPAKAIEIGIGGYFGYKAVEQAIPIIAKAKEEDDYGPLAGYLGSLAIYGYTGIKGYKLGKVYGYGRAEEYLYLRETYAPGTKEHIRFKASLKVARELEQITPKHIKTLDLAKDIQRITPESAQALYDVLLAKKRVVTIGGSASTYPQVRGARPPRDIDLLVLGWKHNLKYVHTKLSKYGHTFDIHGKEFGYPGQYRRFGFLYQARQKIQISLEGKTLTAKTLRASEQLFRKGITSVLKEERLRHGILPGYDFPLKGTRPVLKDIFDFVTTARSLITDAYTSRGVFVKGRAISAEKALQIFLHPEKAPSYIKGALPVEHKPFFWKRFAVAPELLPDVLLFKGKVSISYPKVYPIGVGLGYAPSTIPTKLPSYIPSVKIDVPPYVASYKPSDYVPGYVPTKAPPYVPTPTPPYVSTYEPPYVPTKAPPYVSTYEPPYVPTKAPPYVPTPSPPYIPTYMPPYVPTTTPPYKPPYAPGYTPTTIPPLPPPPKKKILYLPDTTYELFGHTLGQGYHVYVKERHYIKGKKVKEGKMIRLSKRPLSRMDALSLGGMAIDNSAAATFEIKPTNAMAQESLIKLKPFDKFQDKFYMKDSKYIEKRENRIDTKGEVKGISALGWYAEKTAKIAKKKPVVARRPRERMVGKPVDMFDTGMDDMLINMDKIFKGAFNIGF